MIKEEELTKARNDYGLNARKGYPRIMDETDKYICNAFEAGAKWAEEQVQKLFFEKAEEFFFTHTPDEYVRQVGSVGHYFCTTEFFKDFKKEMQE